jgi:hypothetical protein
MGGQGVVVFVSWSGRWRFPLRNDELNPNMRIMVSVKHTNSQQASKHLDALGIVNDTLYPCLDTSFP